MTFIRAALLHNSRVRHLSATERKRRQQLLPASSSVGMSEDAERFRMRARECRELASKARVEEVRKHLLSLADELDEEAGKIDSDEAGTRT